MRRTVVVVVVLTLMSILFTFAPAITQAEHDSSGNLVATVSLSVVSISIATSTLDYGPLHVLTFDNVPDGQGCDPLKDPPDDANTSTASAFVIENTGDVEESFLIEGGDSVPVGGGGGAPWLLVPEGGFPPGLNEYIHRFSSGAYPFVSSPSGAPCFFFAMPNGSAATIANGVSFDPLAGDVFVPIFLNLDMPSSITSPDDWELPILITAVESGA